MTYRRREFRIFSKFLASLLHPFLTLARRGVVFVVVGVVVLGILLPLYCMCQFVDFGVAGLIIIGAQLLDAQLFQWLVGLQSVKSVRGCAADEKHITDFAAIDASFVNLRRPIRNMELVRGTACEGDATRLVHLQSNLR